MLEGDVGTQDRTLYLGCLPVLASLAGVWHFYNPNSPATDQNQAAVLYSQRPLHPGLPLTRGPTFLTGKSLQIGSQKLIYSLDLYHGTCSPDLILGREVGLCSEMAPLQALDVSLMEARARAFRRLE